MAVPSNLSRKSAGFTLVELLIAVAIIAALSSFLIPGFTNYIDNQNIIQAQEAFKSDLRTTQNKALTGVGTTTGTKYWAVKIIGNDAREYHFFKTADNSSAVCTGLSIGGSGYEGTSEKLPGGVVIRQADGACIFFSTRNGDASMANFANDCFVIDEAGVSGTNGVYINAAGLIYATDSCT